MERFTGNITTNAKPHALGQRAELRDSYSALGDGLVRQNNVRQIDVSKVTIGKDTFSMPRVDQVKTMLQDTKDLEQYIDSCYQKTEFANFMGKAVKNENFMNHVRAMCQDQNFVECVSNLCSKPEVMKTLMTLQNNNKDFMSSFKPLLNDNIINGNINAAIENKFSRLLLERVNDSGSKAKNAETSTKDQRVLGLQLGIALGIGIGIGKCCYDTCRQIARGSRQPNRSQTGDIEMV